MEESRATESRPAPPPLPCNGAADGSDAPLVATGTNDSISDIDPTSAPADVIVDSNVHAPAFDQLVASQGGGSSSSTAGIPPPPKPVHVRKRSVRTNSELSKQSKQDERPPTLQDDTDSASYISPQRPHPQPSSSSSGVSH